MPDRQLAKEFRASVPKTRRTYQEKLLDPRWQRKRLEVFNAAGWRCQECGADDQTRAAHHIFYPSCLEGPWDVPSEILLCLCEFHHRERQAVEQVMFVEIAKHMARMNIHDLRRQEIFHYFTEDSTLDYLPIALRERLRWEERSGLKAASA